MESVVIVACETSSKFLLLNYVALFFMTITDMGQRIHEESVNCKLKENKSLKAVSCNILSSKVKPKL